MPLSLIDWVKTIFHSLFSVISTLRGQCHKISIGVDYADTTMTTRTSAVSFGGLSLTLEEQSSEKVLGCVYIFNINI